MTTKHSTGLLAKTTPATQAAMRTPGERLFQLAFTLVQWPWLLKSLYGGTQAEKRALLERIGLPQDALPHLPRWSSPRRWPITAGSCTATISTSLSSPRWTPGSPSMAWRRNSGTRR